MNTLAEAQINKARAMLEAMFAHGTHEYSYLQDCDGKPTAAAKAACKYAEDAGLDHDYDLLKQFFQHVKASPEYKSWVAEDAERQARHSAAAALGRIGGRSTSAAKQAAVRENGKAGGRSPKNVFRASEVEPNGTGWIVDLSPANAVNPDCYWRFAKRADAIKFDRLVKSGVDAQDAQINLGSYK